MNCLVIGAGGPVGVALLHLFREHGWSAHVVDPKRPRHWDLLNDSLGKTLVRWDEQKCTLKSLDSRLKAERFDAVIDLTPTMDKTRAIAVCDKRDVPLINSTVVDCWADIHVAAYNFVDSRPAARRRGHICSSGMNPGAVNAMAEEICKAEGQPDAIIYWEYDDTAPHDGVFRGPSITWCLSESAAEINEDWNFEVIEEGTVLLHEDALDWPTQNYRSAGAPVAELPIPAEAQAFLIGHEECVFMGWRHDTAVKFLYGFHPRNMELLRQGGYSFVPELLLNAPGKVLKGRDIVGVSCQYDNEWQGMYCMLDNTPQTPVDSNATCHLVACGMMASAMCVAGGSLPVGVHLTHEVAGWMDAFRSLAEVRRFLREDAPTTAAVPVLQIPPTPVQTPAAQAEGKYVPSQPAPGLAADRRPSENGIA
jgi:hypothetical protein